MRELHKNNHTNIKLTIVIDANYDELHLIKILLKQNIMGIKNT